MSGFKMRLNETPRPARVRHRHSTTTEVTVQPSVGRIRRLAVHLLFQPYSHCTHLPPNGRPRCSRRLRNKLPPWSVHPLPPVVPISPDRLQGALFTHWIADSLTLWKSPVTDEHLWIAANYYTILAKGPAEALYFLALITLIGGSTILWSLGDGQAGNIMFDGGSICEHLLTSLCLCVGLNSLKSCSA